MTDREQIDAFSNDLDCLIERYCAEFELITAAAIGVLQMKIITLTIHATKDENDNF